MSEPTNGNPTPTETFRRSRRSALPAGSSSTWPAFQSPETGLPAEDSVRIFLPGRKPRHFLRALHGTAANPPAGDSQELPAAPPEAPHLEPFEPASADTERSAPTGSMRPVPAAARSTALILLVAGLLAGAVIVAAGLLLHGRVR